MNKYIISTLLLIFCFKQATSQDAKQVIVGTKHSLHSNILNEDRKFWVSLPESYNDQASSHKKYPLLIILDSNIHFKAITGMVDYMSSAYNLKIPEMIVVGVINIDRRRDFTPDKIITVRENNTGGGEKFLRFLEDELIKELDENYRTASYRILFGHSLGGLITTHAYMKKNTVFNSFIVVDPSFGTWDSKTMDTKLDAITQKSFKRFLYIATANWGKRNITNRDRHMRLYESLNRKCEGYFPAKLEYFENENHSSISLIAFYNGISTIFDGYRIYYRNIETVEQLKQHFQILSQQLSWSFKPPEALVNRVGYRMLQSSNKKDKVKALSFFLLNTESFPNSYNAFDSLAEAYEVLGDKINAINNYKKSLSLNPNNENATMKIESLNEN
ncbi:alpha/beta hydrolase-fold protein [Tenacibaculum aestuarii]|uniref:alpha/beta hydrolase-fold protein n=1 Tax=Tenacibaculum aestuarii TaxID=362781 RepID=UPI0038965997